MIKFINIILEFIYSLRIFVKKYYKAKVDPKLPIYSICGFKNQIDKSKPTKVIIKLNHSVGKTLVVNLDELVYKRKDLLFDFSNEETIQLITMAATNREVITIKTFIGGKFIIPLSILFSVALVAANIQSSKVIDIYGIYLGGGVFSFATVLIIGNIITEVYGYKTSRIVVWGAFFASLFFLLGNYICLSLKPAPMWNHQASYEVVLGVIPKFVFASLLAYCFGEFVNSIVIAKMKISDMGNSLWKRIVVSSIIAISVDTMIFVFIAYYQYFSHPIDLISMGFMIYLKKTIFEIIALPFVCIVINLLKNYEQKDIYDFDTNFTPFSIDVNYDQYNNKWNEKRVFRFS